jgi:hypothetical protein
MTNANKGDLTGVPVDFDEETGEEESDEDE